MATTAEMKRLIGRNVRLAINGGIGDRARVQTVRRGEVVTVDSFGGENEWEIAHVSIRSDPAFPGEPVLDLRLG